MAMPNKYFQAPTPQPDLPRIRAWKSFRRDPAVDHVEVEVLRERDGLVSLPARLAVSFCGANGEVARYDEAPWEPELNRNA